MLIAPRKTGSSRTNTTSLTTCGLLKDSTRSAVRDWIEQLSDQEYIERVGEYSVLKLTEKGRLVLKGLGQPLRHRDEKA